MIKLLTMQQAAAIGKGIFKRVKFILEPGITTARINDEIRSHIEGAAKYAEARPVFKGYGTPAFPAESCISVNEEVCHGIPGDRVIGGGDLVSIDLGIEVDGYVVDACRTFEIGAVSEEADHLNYWTRTILQRALRHIRAGVCWQDVARIIENSARKKDLSIIKEMTGHGVGEKLHEPPKLRNYTCAENKAIILTEGQTICVEPMLTLGSGGCEIADDNWTVLTVDRKLASHWEHCIVVTETGCEILL